MFSMVEKYGIEEKATMTFIWACCIPCSYYQMIFEVTSFAAAAVRRPTLAGECFVRAGARPGGREIRNVWKLGAGRVVATLHAPAPCERRDNQIDGLSLAIDSASRILAAPFPCAA